MVQNMDQKEIEYQDQLDQEDDEIDQEASEQAELEYRHQQALEEERLNREAAEKNAQKQAILQAAAAQEKQKEPIINFLSDIPFILAIGLALLKDLVDFIGIGSSPLIGTVITLMIFIVLAMMVFLAQPSAFFGNFGILFGGTVVEEIPGINLLPAYTAAAVWVYIRTILKRIAKSKNISSSSRLAKYLTK